MTKYEEQIGVRLPDGRRYMATVLVGPLESDEEILVRMTKEVGTIFNVNAQKLLVTSLKPFKLKNITETEDEDSEVQRPARIKLTDYAQLSTEAQEEARRALVSKAKVEREPKSERRPSASTPVVGERWRPKDPRRLASFVVTEVTEDSVLTDDGRSIALNRFGRYVRVEGNAASEADHG